MDNRLLVIVLTSMVGLSVAAVLMILRDLYANRRLAIRNRLQGSETPDIVRPMPFASAPAGRGLTGGIDRWFYRLTIESGASFSPEVVLLLAVAAGLLLGGGLFIWREEMAIAVGGFALGMVITLGLFAVLRWRRLGKIREQLPEVVDMIARSVRAGESIDQAIASVARRTSAPLGIEIRRLASQLQMGLSLEAAMEGLTRRAPLNETRILAATFLVQRQAGGHLPVTLERLAKVIRDRMAYYRQFRAATSATRWGAVLIALAGPAALIFLANFEPDYLQSFIELRLGQMLLAIAIVLQVVGVIWIFRLLRVDY